MSYYLIINEKYVIDFSSISAFADMNKYLKLNIFTCCFKNQEELVKALKDLKLIPETIEVEKICVARRKNKNENNYQFVTNDIAYSDTLPFMAKTTIIYFLLSQQHNQQIIQSFTEEYIHMFDSYVQSKKINGQYKEFCNRMLTSLKIISRISEKPTKKMIDYDEDAEFKTRIEETINYIIDGSEERKRNYRELLKLAKFVRKCAHNHKIDCRRIQTEKYEHVVENLKELINVQIALRAQKYASLDSINLMYPMHDDDIELKKLIEKEEHEEETHDILFDREEDDYMFLEPEDFEKMLRENSVRETREAVETDIENLEELKKNRFKK